MGILDSIGSLIPGDQAQAPAPSAGVGGQIPSETQGSTWTDFIAKNRPFLKDMAAQLTAGYAPGGTGRELMTAFGHGLQGDAARSEEDYNRAVQQQGVQLKESEGEANRASHEKVAQIGADSRNEVAQIKTEAMLERARLIAKPQNSQEMTIASKAEGDYYKKEKDNQIVSRKSDAQIAAEAKSWGLNAVQHARDAAGVRSVGAPLEGGGASSGAPASGSAPPAASVGSTTADTTNKGTPTKPWAEYIQDPKVVEAMKDPTFRADLEKAHPEYKTRIHQYMTEQGATNFRKNYYPKALGGE